LIFLKASGTLILLGNERRRLSCLEFVGVGTKQRCSASPTTGSIFDRIVEGRCRDSGRIVLNWRFICFLSMRMENSPSVSFVGIATTLLFSTSPRDEESDNHTCGEVEGDFGHFQMLRPLQWGGTSSAATLPSFPEKYLGSLSQLKNSRENI